MTEQEWQDLFYAVERRIAERDADEVGGIPDEVPYIQAGDVEDVVTALEELGYTITKA